METFIADANGHIDVPGNTATYPPGYTIYFLHGQFAGMAPPKQEEDGPAQPLQGNSEFVIGETAQQQENLV